MFFRPNDIDTLRGGFLSVCPPLHQTEAIRQGNKMKVIKSHTSKAEDMIIANIESLFASYMYIRPTHTVVWND